MEIFVEKIVKNDRWRVEKNRKKWYDYKVKLKYYVCEYFGEGIRSGETLIRWEINNSGLSDWQNKNLKKGEMKNEKEKTFGMAHDIGYDGWAHASNCVGGRTSIFWLCP